MYSESDVQSAVEAGAITAESAEALRAHVAALRATPAVDEEQFRLITGFNDIFVSIACLLVIFAASAIGTKIADGLGGLLVAFSSWGMAEVFTRQRRMALPSIILLLAFVLGLGFAASSALEHLLPKHAVNHGGPGQDWTTYDHHPWQTGLIMLGGAAAAAIGALAHWRRFRVAITIAAAAGAVTMLVLSLVAIISNDQLWGGSFIASVALVCGLATFAYAMHWDMSDRARTTQRADIAFWLHLLAAPLIAHPLFYWMGVTQGHDLKLATALGILVIYVAFAVTAIAIDRRAILVSALTYVLIALAQLFRAYGAIELNVALTALIIGSALLALSAWWQPIRRQVIGCLPDGIRTRLAPIG